MPGTTPGGVQYPLPTEPVRDGALRMQLMAEAFDQDPVELLAGRSSGTVNVATATWVPMQWSFEAYRSGPASALTLTPDGIQAALSGRYAIEAFVSLPAATGGARRIIGVGPYNTSPWGTGAQHTCPPINASTQLRISLTRSLSAGNERVTVFVYQDSGTTMTVDNSQAGIMVRRLRLGQPHA